MKYIVAKPTKSAAPIAANIFMIFIPTNSGANRRLSFMIDDKSNLTII